MIKGIHLLNLYLKKFNKVQEYKVNQNVSLKNYVVKWKPRCEWAHDSRKRSLCLCTSLDTVHHTALFLLEAIWGMLYSCVLNLAASSGQYPQSFDHRWLKSSFIINTASLCSNIGAQPDSRLGQVKTQRENNWPADCNDINDTIRAGLWFPLWQKQVVIGDIGGLH